MRPYAITGVGMVSPIGVGYASFREALSTGAPSSDVFVEAPTPLSTDKLPGAVAAEVAGFDAADHVGKKGLRTLDRLTRMLIVAAKYSLEAAGLRGAGDPAGEDAGEAPPPPPPIDAQRLGVCSATAYGSLDVISEMAQVAELEDPRFLNPSRFPNTVINSSAGYVSIWHDLRAPNVTVVDGNCGSLDAFLTGDMHISNGRADAFLVGGGEVLSDSLYMAFRKLEVLADPVSDCAPGLAESKGMRIGEGAAYVCMERAQAARDRGARVLAEVIGYGTAFEPPDSEAAIVHASQLAVERALKQALDDAGISPADVDLVVSSVSGIPRFDAAELVGIETCLAAVPVVAPKTWYGESFGAGGALALCATLCFFDGVTPAPMVRGEAPADASTAVILSVGYYGNVSALVLRRP